MSSANISMTEDQFLCSICLDIFNEPVSTPCGHNFCKQCITRYWTAAATATTATSQCPLCKEVFQKTPDLKVNTEFRDMLELFKRKAVSADGESSPPPPRAVEVLCDFCHVKRKALKSCLVCFASFCSGHLKPHHSVQALQWHKLIDPVKDLKDRVCKKHNKGLEFFCRDDQSCVCALCLKEQHKTHQVVALEEELKEVKVKLKQAKKEVKHTVEEKHNTIQQIQSSKIRSRAEMERMQRETEKAFGALGALIWNKSMKLIQQLEEKQRTAELQAETLVQQLQKEIAEENLRYEELEELSKTDDHFRLLKGLPSTSSAPNTKHPLVLRPLLNATTVQSAVSRIEEVLEEQMENITREISREEQRRIENPFDDELGNIKRQHAVNLTLDPDTAHPSLIVSKDRKQVRDGGARRSVPDTPTRFDPLHFVLGDEGFSSGKFYFEVQLKGQTTWEIGVTRDTVDRKSVQLSLCPENGCWTLGSYWGRCQANTNPPQVLTPSKEPGRVGVFVDYEGGLVSFYDADSRALIYSFSGCTFSASVHFLRHMLVSRIYPDTKTKIYPLFRPSAELDSDSASLQIVLLDAPDKKDQTLPKETPLKTSLC